MKHVFVETNWVFELCAPAHRSTPEAKDLAVRAARGDLVLRDRRGGDDGLGELHPSGSRGG